MDSPDPQGNQVAVEYSSAVVQALQAVDPAHSLVELVGSPDLLDSQEAAEYLQSLDPAQSLDLVAQEGSPGLQDSQGAEDD